MKKSTGVVAILVGIGILFISILFSKGSHPSLGFIGSMARMEIVLNEGQLIKAKTEYVDGVFPYTREVHPAYVEGRVAIPLKYPLALSIIIILSGVGIFVLAEKSPLGGTKNAEEA